MGKKLIHYRNRCIGCGICYEKQPQYWRMSRKDGKATLLRAQNKNGVYVTPLDPFDETLAQEVAIDCPVRIIKIS